jgi:hypothetical protein
MSAQALLEAGYLSPGRCWTLAWPAPGCEDGAMVGETGETHIVVTYRCRTPEGRWRTVGGVLHVNITPELRGKKRAWFQCPGDLNGVGSHFVDSLEASEDGFLCAECTLRRKENTRRPVSV